MIKLDYCQQQLLGVLLAEYQGLLAPATRGNLLECGYIRSCNVSGAKAPATKGNLLECNYIRSCNVSKRSI